MTREVVSSAHAWSLKIAMIENEELGLKIAETEDEAFWEEVKQNAQSAIGMQEEQIVHLNKSIRLSKEVIKLAETNLQSRTDDKDKQA